MFSGCTEGAEPGAGASANADLSCIIQGRAGEGTRTKIPLGEGSSPGSRALDSQLWSLCWWKQVGRAVTTASFLTSSPQTVLRIVVLGIWDYIENKIEVKTVSLAPPEPAILEAGNCHCPIRPRVGAISKGQLPPTLDTRVCPAVPLGRWGGETTEKIVQRKNMV